MECKLKKLECFTNHIDIENKSFLTRTKCLSKLFDDLNNLEMLCLRKFRSIFEMESTNTIYLRRQTSKALDETDKEI